MIIEIRGTNTQNKGAQLMLQAICARLGDQFDLSVPPVITDYAVRSRLGLRQTLYEPGLPRLSSFLGNAVPKRIRTQYGLTDNREISGVLDAAGFRHTDQFDPSLSRREALVGRSWARRGVPKILLPQAFGPFNNPETRRWAREALEQATLIFVRDGVSAEHIRGLDLSTTTARSPDFTIGLKPSTIDAISDEPFLALVPNTKLFTHGDVDRPRYIQVLREYGEVAAAHGLKTVVVVHEETDHGVAAELAERANAQLFSSADPLVLKAALGQANAAVASRFHAVVGCLSQSVPTLAFGWSHKYQELLKDFGVDDRLVTPDTDPKQALANLLSDDAGNKRQEAALPELVGKVDLMWEQTIAALPNR